MCYYSEILIPATTWINLEIVMPCEISRKWTNIVILLYEAALEKEMATHSSDLAWRIPWTGVWCSIVHRVAESNMTE